jgi:hypothetical protein
VYDTAKLLDPSCIEDLFDTSILLADFAVNSFGINQAAQQWLVEGFPSWVEQHTIAIDQEQQEVVPPSSVTWLFSKGVQDGMCFQGITETLTMDAVEDAAAMWDAVATTLDLMYPPPANLAYDSPWSPDYRPTSPVNDTATPCDRSSNPILELLAPTQPFMGLDDILGPLASPKMPTTPMGMDLLMM